MASVIGFLLILSASAHALDLNEELANVRILDVHPDNVVVLNRRGEDGVWVGNHARLRNAEGYAARAFLHETDHCNGKLFIDHLPKLRREMVIKRFKKEKSWK